MTVIFQKKVLKRLRSKRTIVHKLNWLFLDESQCPIAPSPPPSDPVDPSGQFEISKMDVVRINVFFLIDSYFPAE